MDGWWNEETKNQELLLRIQSARKIIKLMKYSLFPFGEQLVKWCDGGANGNLST